MAAMCNSECVDFVMKALTESDLRGKRVIEVGSYDVNGSVRQTLEARGVDSYVGVDIEQGPCVDVVQDATRLLEKFEPGSFDVVLSTEVVEHIRNWRAAFAGMKALCAEGGVVVVTTRSPGFGYHAYPDDFWRYTPEDMDLIFADFCVELLESQIDPREPGVFVKARRDSGRRQINLDPIALHSIVTDKRQINISQVEIRRFLLMRQVNLAIKPVSRYIPQAVKAPFKKRMGLGPGF
jgi:SAM-dependent methyltransferase